MGSPFGREAATCVHRTQTLASTMDSVHIDDPTRVTGMSARLAPHRPPVRATYRHGDLRRALLDAGVALARAGGPQAVVLREATRRAGVVPNAAYRHFASRDALLQAVRSEALAALAIAMERELSRLRPGTSPGAFARASLRAVGTAYLRFAQRE